MNERIRELAEQADMFVLRDEDGDPQAYYLIGKSIEKFAELIVRECAEVSVRTGALNEADYEGEMIADAIKRHFGVE